MKIERNKMILFLLCRVEMPGGVGKDIEEVAKRSGFTYEFGQVPYFAIEPYFILKDGTRTDEAVKRDVDWSKMLLERREGLPEAYARFLDLKHKAGMNKGWLKQVAAFDYGIKYKDMTDRFETEQEYIARNTSLAPWAVFHNGISSIDYSDGGWDHERWMKLVSTLPPESKLTIYTCNYV